MTLQRCKVKVLLLILPVTHIVEVAFGLQTNFSQLHFFPSYSEVNCSVARPNS